MVLLVSGCTTQPTPQAAPAFGATGGEPAAATAPPDGGLLFAMKNSSMPRLGILRLDFTTSAPLQLWVQDAGGRRVGEHFVRASTERRVDIDLDITRTETQAPFSLHLFAAPTAGGDVFFERQLDFEGPSLSIVDAPPIQVGIVDERLENVTVWLRNSGDVPALVDELTAEYRGATIRREYSEGFVPPGEQRVAIVEVCSYCEGARVVVGALPVNITVSMANGAVISGKAEIVRTGPVLTAVWSNLTRRESWDGTLYLDKLRVNVTNSGDVTTAVTRWQVGGHTESWSSLYPMSVAPGRTTSILLDAAHKNVRVGPSDTPWRLDFEHGAYVTGLSP